MDSLTRYAQAQREIALAVGEPPATKATHLRCLINCPSWWSAPATARRWRLDYRFYTVLSEGDDMQDPIADASRAILDGHIVLSRRLAEEGHYPAIDIEASVSRVMPQIVDEMWLKAQLCKQMMAHYRQNQDLISVGAYQSGADNLLDAAIDRLPTIKAMLRQGLTEGSDLENSKKQLDAIFPAQPPEAKK